MNRRVWKQPHTWGQVSFPKPSKSFVLVNDEKTFPETAPAVKSSHLTFNFHHLQRWGDRFAENAGETDAHEALRARESVVLFHRGHHRLAWTLNPETSAVVFFFLLRGTEKDLSVHVRHLNIHTEEETVSHPDQPYYVTTNPRHLDKCWQELEH